MNQLHQSKLVFRTVQKGKKKQIVVPVANPKDLREVRPSELSAELAAMPLEKLDGIEVEFEIDRNQPTRVRKKGEPWKATASQQVSQTADKGQHPKSQPKTSQPSHSTNTAKHFFHNPYNFIPALPRDTERVKGELADHPPVGHDRYREDGISGRISVKLTVKTPLLIPDAAKMTVRPDGHKTYPVRLGPDGKPYLPPTSVKGMLRAAYEAVTNSRMGVFAGHEERLAYRRPAQTGLAMVPARIVREDNSDHIELLQGTSPIGSDGSPRRRDPKQPGDMGDPMYAAWLPRWDRNTGDVARWAIHYARTGRLPRHRERVKAWVELINRAPFCYWLVREIVPFEQSLGPKPPPSNPRGKHVPAQPSTFRKIDGYVCVTSRQLNEAEDRHNIDGHHDEKVFFREPSQPRVHVPLTRELQDQWQVLINNYQQLHADDIKRGILGPSACRHAMWSRHVFGSEAERELKVGSLCFCTLGEMFQSRN